MGLRKKECTHTDELSAQGHRLHLFEPIVFRFNLNDPRIFLFFFCNRHATGRNHDAIIDRIVLANELKFDIDYCSQ